MDLQVLYQKKEHLQHIYDLPDTYTGSIDLTEQEMYVLDAEKKEFVRESVAYVPGLFKIFDEILVNALDHKQRDPEMKNIRVDVSPGLGAISVWNDGKGIDVERHPVYGEYIVEMLFGQLLTSSNYERGPGNTKRVVGGKNGYGAKLTNIFSTKFCIETVDATRQKKYIQTFSNNMREKSAPIITACNTRPYTRVTFTPDYAKFGCPDGLTSQMYKLFERRIYDIAGCVAASGNKETVSVYINGERCRIRGFEKYVATYFPQASKYMDVEQERWKVGLCLAPSGQGYTEVSFVNGIWTQKGGKHSEHVCGQIVDKIKEAAAKHPKLREKVIRNAAIKEHLFLFISCVIENPSFTSQTKEEMSSKVSDFGSRWNCCEKMVEKFLKGGGLLERLVDGASTAEERSLKKSDGNKKSSLFVPKLEDANYAGTKRSLECTLILTEGDSAKASALAGLSVHGPSFRDRFGVFPLKGKFLNVREASNTQILGNEEVKNLKKILGLQQGKEYTPENMKDLRYGSVSLMTDQDSVTGDTPVLLCMSKHQDQTIKDFCIYAIQDLFDVSKSFLLENGKQVYYMPENNICAWTSRGPSLVRKVIRHRTSKRIFRVFTRHGIVDVSEDHSLLTADRNKVSPTEFASDPDTRRPNVDLLHSLPGAHSGMQHRDAQSWGQKVFYEHSKLSAQSRYLTEYYAGKHVTVSFDDVGKCYLIISRPTEGDTCFSRKVKYSESFCRGLQVDNLDHVENTEPECTDEEVPAKSKDFSVIRVVDLGDMYRDQFVYDLETENHEFQAGIGELIVHNTDGSHIKGLIINFFDHFFPSLLKIEGFLKSFITPIVRGFKADGNAVNFYTLQDYARFRETDASRGYTFKYYKGLGTSSSQEMQEYFRNIDNITVNYEYDPHIGGRDMELAFRKTMANERKLWLRIYDPADTVEYKQYGNKKHLQHVVSISDFVHKDLKHFSNADNVRSIPSLVDGLKPSQRKVLYGTLKKCASLGGGSVKVAQLSGYISEKTSYHHGESSLEQTIVSMAQKFVGKNNVNWLEPLGMFGTRLMGGKDHASSRYIFTRVAPLAYKTFRDIDDRILEYLDDDGDPIEPKTYFPVVPTILLNGCEGIGTGYSTSVPCFNPLDVVSECENYIRGAETSARWVPWYEGFNGRILETVGKVEGGGHDANSNIKCGGNFVTLGVVEPISVEGKVLVTELPVGLWTDVFKEFLEEQIRLYRESVDSKTKKAQSVGSLYRAAVTNYINRSTEETVCFEVYYEKSAQVVGVAMPEAFASDFPDEDPLQLLWIYRLRLFSRINLCNMYLYVGNELKKFSTVPEILTCFAIQRLQKYAERKEHLLGEYESALVHVQERRRFLELVLSGSLVIFNKPREEVHKLLLEHGFQKKNDSFDYCVKMPIDSLTRDKLDALHNEIAALAQQLEHLKSQSPQDMWMQELQEWRETYDSLTASAKKKTSGENGLKRRQTSEKNQAKTKRSRAPPHT